MEKKWRNGSPSWAPERPDRLRHSRETRWDPERSWQKKIDPNWLRDSKTDQDEQFFSKVFYWANRGYFEIFMKEVLCLYRITIWVLSLIAYTSKRRNRNSVTNFAKTKLAFDKKIENEILCATNYLYVVFDKLFLNLLLKSLTNYFTKSYVKTDMYLVR